MSVPVVEFWEGGPQGPAGPPGEAGAGEWGEIAGTLADQADLAAALAGKASTVHTHTFSQITDGREVVEDYIATALTGGTQAGITITYTDNGSGAGVYNFVVAPQPVTVRDVGGAVEVPATAIEFPDGSVTDQSGGVARVRFGLFQQPVTGTSGTLNGSHDGILIRTTNGSAVTLTLDNSAPAGTQLAVVQAGAGQVTFTAEAGGTLHNRAGHTKTAGQWATVSLYVDSNSGTNAVWVLSGDTAA